MPRGSGFVHLSLRGAMRRGRVHRCGCGQTGKNCSFRQKKSPHCSCEKLRSLPLEGDGGFYFSFNITAPAEPQLIWYYFIIDVAPEHDGGETTRLFYGAPETRSGIGKFYPAWETPPDYQITVFARDFETPNWFRHGIVYQIFPDRSTVSV